MAPNTYPEIGHVEQGYADVLAEHRHPEPSKPPPLPSWLLRWEDNRPRWVVELVAEFIGVFIYVYSGVGATAAFVFSSAAKEEGFGNLLTVGLSYGLAIAFAILVAAPTSGGHLSPGYTVSFAIFKGFPWRKVPQYICAQILGGMVACLFVYGQYHQQFTSYAGKLKLAGAAGEALMFTPSGPAGILAVYPTPGQHLGYVFLNELVANTFLAVIVWSVLDSSNFFITFSSAPILIGGAYMVVIWAFAVDTVSLNTARDLGGRIVAAIYYGHKAFPAHYSALAALTNILGTFLGASIQTFFLSDTNRPMVNHFPEMTKDGKALKADKSIRAVTQSKNDDILARRQTFASFANLGPKTSNGTGNGSGTGTGAVEKA